MFKTPVSDATLIRTLSFLWGNFRLFWILHFEFVSDFVLRISNFLSGRTFINS